MVRNQDSHILINYCYNPKETDILFIEKSISDIGLLVNQARGSSNIISDNLIGSGSAALLLGAIITIYLSTGGIKSIIYIR